MGGFVMKRMVLGVAGLLVAVSALDRLSAAESLIDNPICTILSKYGISNDELIGDFKKAARNLFGSLESAREVYSTDSTLNEKWERSQDVIRRAVLAIEGGVDKDELARLKDELGEITRNGFFYSSVVSIAFLPDGEKLRVVLDGLWQCLLQADEIVLWNVLASEKVAKDVLPWSCHEMSRLICCSAPVASSLLWNISLIHDVPQAIEELGGQEVESAKASARQELKEADLAGYM
jgi:hypothetical protein